MTLLQADKTTLSAHTREGGYPSLSAQIDPCMRRSERFVWSGVVV